MAAAMVGLMSVGVGVARFVTDVVVVVGGCCGGRGGFDYELVVVAVDFCYGPGSW